MADIYVINPTDGNTTRSFSVSPYTTNGDQSPVSSALDVSAVSSNTSLLFHGKGKDSYGERIQENFYHLLENFANPNEPHNPINGQVWYDTNDSTLKVFDRFGVELYDIDNPVINSVIFRMKGNTTSRYFQKNREAAIARFTGGFKFSIYDIATGDFVGDYIATSATAHASTDKIVVNLDTITNIQGVNGSPVNPIIQTIGAWKSVQAVNPEILEDVFSNVTPIYPSFDGIVVDMDMGTNYITNLPALNLSESGTASTPDSDSYFWAVNKGYVDDYFLPLGGGIVTGNVQITGNLELGSYPDVEQALDDLNTTVGIHNHDADYVELAGDTMTGFLTLNADPINPLHAATMGYVDTLIAAVSGGAELGDLTDVVMTSEVAGHRLEFDGANWVNVPNTLNGFSDTDFIKSTTGGTVSTGGVLKLLGQPGQNGNAGVQASEDAITFQELTDTVNDQFNSVLPNGDIYVVGGTYDGGTDVLTLFRTGGQPDVLVSGIAAGVGTSINNTNAVTHTILPLHLSVGDYLETTWSNDLAFPDFVLSNMIESISEGMKRMQGRNTSASIVSNGRVTPYNLDTELEMSYTGGFNSLQVYINGQKYICNMRGLQELEKSGGDIFHSIATGLSNDPTLYSFNINVDGGGNQLVQFTGNQAQNFRFLVDTINTEMISNSIDARAIVFEGVIAFYSHSGGSSSSILITDVNLISSLTGVSLVTPVNGITYDYEEITEFGNTDGALIQFENTIPSSSIIEFVNLTVGGATDINGFEV